MLLRLYRLAQQLSFFRPFSLTIAVGALFLAMYCLLIDSAFTAQVLEPAIIAALWSLLLFAFLQIFQTIPPPVLPHDSFLKKLSVRIKLTLYSLLAFIVLATSILLFWMSIRLLLV